MGYVYYKEVFKALREGKMIRVTYGEKDKLLYIIKVCRFDAGSCLNLCHRHIFCNSDDDRRMMWSRMGYLDDWEKRIWNEMGGYSYKIIGNKELAMIDAIVLSRPLNSYRVIDERELAKIDAEISAKSLDSY